MCMCTTDLVGVKAARYCFALACVLSLVAAAGFKVVLKILTLSRDSLSLRYSQVG